MRRHRLAAYFDNHGVGVERPSRTLPSPVPGLDAEACGRPGRDAVTDWLRWRARRGAGRRHNRLGARRPEEYSGRALAAFWGGADDSEAHWHGEPVGVRQRTRRRQVSPTEEKRDGVSRRRSTSSGAPLFWAVTRISNPHKLVGARHGRAPHRPRRQRRQHSDGSPQPPTEIGSARWRCPPTVRPPRSPDQSSVAICFRQEQVDRVTR